MKVEIEKIKEKASFVPYKVTFTIFKREDSTKFHDDIARHVTCGTQRLSAEIYKRSTNGDFDKHYISGID